MTETKTEDQEPENVLRFRFRANFKSPTLELGHGEYRRLFKADEQPFAVTSLEEAQMLQKDPHFVEHKEGDELTAPADGVVKTPIEGDSISGEDDTQAKAASSRRTPKPAGKIGGAPAAEAEGH